MAMHKLQCQVGISLGLFLHRYGDESNCEDAVEQQRWPKGVECAGCGHHGHYAVRHGHRRFDVSGILQALLGDADAPVPRSTTPNNS